MFFDCFMRKSKTSVFGEQIQKIKEYMINRLNDREKIYFRRFAIV